MFEIRVGNEKTFFEDDHWYHLGCEMRRYCDNRLASENVQKTIDTDKKIILAIKLYTKVTEHLDYDDVYNLVFKGKDYYDIVYFDINNFDLYNEYFENYGEGYIYPINEFDDIVLANKTPSECFELAFNIEEHEYRCADYFQYDYDLKFYDNDSLVYEMNCDSDFRDWLRRQDHYYEIQDEIDGIVEDWEDEYEVEF